MTRRIGTIDLVDLPGAGKGVPTAAGHLCPRQHLGEIDINDACMGFVYAQHIGYDVVSLLKSFTHQHQMLVGERPGYVVDTKVRRLLGQLGMITGALHSRFLSTQGSSS